jgi:tRNA (cytidine/uridine-2'-O-)-methyltransferase
MRLTFFQPDIPQNLGAAIRLTACLATPLDIIEPCAFPLDDRAISRVALDYGRAHVQRHRSFDAFLAALKPQQRLILLTTKASQTHFKFVFLPDDILLMGSESGGASLEAHEAADARIRIPMAAGLRSLNVVTASALALGEALRQTGLWPETGLPPETG